MDVVEHEHSSGFAENEGFQALPAGTDDSENDEPILENSGYQSIDDNTHQVEESKPIDPMLSRLVDRQMKRLEDEYRATSQAIWSTPVDSRIDKYLDRLETRISKMEDVFEYLSSGQETEQEAEAHSEQTYKPKRTPLQVEEIKKQANSIQMGTLPDFLQNSELTIEELMARLQVGSKEE